MMNTKQQLMLLAEDIKKRDYSLAHKCQEIARGVDDWVKVEDKEKPTDMKTILVSDGVSVSEGYFSDDFEDSHFGATGENSWMLRNSVITIWRELPTPPAED